MSEITLRKIIDELSDLKESPPKYQLIQINGLLANGAAATDTQYMAVIPYRSWKVVNVGFVTVVAGASAVAEQISFGMAACDASAADDLDCFGKFSQDVAAGENIAIGDCFQYVNDSELSTVLAPAGGGTGHAWTAGSPNLFNQWMSKTGLITTTKVNVGSSTARVHSWAIIEIGEV